MDADGGGLEGGAVDGASVDAQPDGGLCGNGIIDPGEACDTDDVGSLSCADYGYETGQLRCSGDCTADTSECTFICGNGAIDQGEDCDGQMLGGVTCQDLGFSPGVLSCASDCSWDLTGCPGCGNTVKEEGEQCDVADFGALACQGDLACTEDCVVDARGCVPPSTGQGTDGPLYVYAGETVSLSDSWAVAQVVTGIGPSSVDVVSAAGLSAGDEVILASMQGGANDCDSAGGHEFLEVATVSATRLTFVSPVDGVYGVGGANSDLTGQAVVVQRVPHFSSVTVFGGGVLTVDGWDGEKGGLLAMRVAGGLTVEHTAAISVDGLGYRGGAGWTETHDSDGRQGESLCGNPQGVSVQPNDGGGGGGRCMVDASDPCGQGGGGGGYGTPGEWAGYSATCESHGNDDPSENGGAVYGSASLERILLGSGGGAGATDDHSETSGSGGRGGGIILIYSGQLSLAGLMTARGGDGTGGSDPNDSGNGGGGSGGTVLIKAGIIEGAGLILATGGHGLGSVGEWNNGGGMGGAGRVRMSYQAAGGFLHSTQPAQAYLDALCEPPSGPSDLYLW